MNQNITANNSGPDAGQLIVVREDMPDDLGLWAAAYFRVEVTTTAKSQIEQKRDIKAFLAFMQQEEKTEARARWTPRLSRAFLDYLRLTLKEDGQRRWSDRTVNRMMAHLKTWAKWINKIRPFPMGNPMDKIRGLKVGSSLEIERALTDSERRRLLDAADLLLTVGGLSRDRRRNKGDKARKQRKGYRPYRNRAILYTLIETGMRRGAICRLNLADINLERRALTVEEKGGHQHTYPISTEGIRAIADYLKNERGQDATKWNSPAVFLTAATNTLGDGRLTARNINQIWQEICLIARVEGKTPHSARHAMGKHIIKKTGNIAAVQRQLGHKNATYSMQYARITNEELQEVLDKR